MINVQTFLTGSSAMVIAGPFIPVYPLFADNTECLVTLRWQDLTEAEACSNGNVMTVACKQRFTQGSVGSSEAPCRVKKTQHFANRRELPNPCYLVNGWSNSLHGLLLLRWHQQLGSPPLVQALQCGRQTPVRRAVSADMPPRDCAD
jgi:hypothetical protein